MPFINQDISKYNGECLNRAKWKYCYYWNAKISKENGRTIGFRCSLFDKDKEGLNSLPECDTKYGLNYDGKTI